MPCRLRIGQKLFSSVSSPILACSVLTSTVGEVPKASHNASNRSRRPSSDGYSHPPVPSVGAFGLAAALLQGEPLPGVRKFDAFIASAPVPGREGSAENSHQKRSSFWGSKQHVIKAVPAIDFIGRPLAKNVRICEIVGLYCP